MVDIVRTSSSSSVSSPAGSRRLIPMHSRWRTSSGSAGCSPASGSAVPKRIEQQREVRLDLERRLEDIPYDVWLTLEMLPREP